MVRQTWIKKTCLKRKKLVTMVMDINYTCYGNHFAMYTNNEILCCKPEINMFYMSIIPRFLKKIPLKI